MNKNISKIGKNATLSVLSQIPIVSAFSKFCEDFVQDNWQERINLWKEDVVKRLSQLDIETEEKIRNTSNFSSILASAQRGALEDIEEDKVALYVNAIVNSIENENIDDTKKHIFLNMLRELTLLHIEALKFFNQSHQQLAGFQHKVTLTQRTMYDIIVGLEPKLDSGDAILDVVLQDLKTKSMLLIDRVDSIHTSLGRINKLTTNLGDEFLSFIAEQKKTL